LQQIVKTKKTELLFLALFIRLLKPGGRAAVIVPDGVLFGSSKAHKELRRLLVEEQKLDAVVSLPGGAFRPYAGVSTAILFFTRNNSGGTDNVWFYDVEADGWSLDDKRHPLLDADKPGASPKEPLSKEEQSSRCAGALEAPCVDTECERPRTAQSFCVPKSEIAENGYDLSLNRYKQVVYEEVAHVSPKRIPAELMELEREIETGLKELDMLVSLPDGHKVCKTLTRAGAVLHISGNSLSATFAASAE
jgi:type I restriction enzyme M protein